MEKFEQFYKDGKFLAAARELTIIAEALEENSKIQELIEVSKKIIDCYLKYADTELMDGNYYNAATKLIEAADIYFDLEEEDHAEILIKKSISYFEKSGDLNLKIESYEEAGEIFMQGAYYCEKYLDYESTNELYQKAILSYQKASDEVKDTEEYRQYLKHLQNVAMINEKLKIYKEAINKHKEVIEVAKKRKITPIATESYIRLYNCYEIMDEHKKAFNTLNEGLDFNRKEAELAIELEDLLEASIAYENTLKILDLMENTEKAIEISKKLANVFLSIADTYEGSNLENYARYLRNAALIYQKMNLPEFQKQAAILFEKIGETLLKLNKFEEASENFLESVLLFNNIGELKRSVESSINAVEAARKSDSKIAIIESLRIAINNFIQVEQRERSKEYVYEIGKYLKDLSFEEEKVQNFHISAIYLSEFGEYLREINDNEYITIFDQSVTNYKKAVKLAIEEHQDVIASYSLLCGILLNIVNNKLDLANKLIEEFKNNEKINKQKYFSFALELIHCVADKSCDIEPILLNYEPIIKNSAEISDLINKLVKMNS